MEEIRVLVPPERIAEFHMWFGAWLAGKGNVALESVAPEAVAPQAAIEWTGEDQDLAMWLWPKLSDSAKAFFGHFADRPDERFTGDEAADAAGIPGGGSSVGGILGWPGRYGYQVSRLMPIKLEGGKYWMDSDVAKIFREVRNSN